MEAALKEDSNMPPLDAEKVVEGEVVEESPKAESAPAEQAEAPAETEEDQGSERFQKRINKVTADKFAQERRADDLERQLAEAQVNIPQQPSVEAAPKLEDFDYDEQKYQDALIDHKVNQKAQEFTRQSQEAAVSQHRVQRQQAFDARIEVFAADAPDYQDVVGRIPPLSQDTLDAIVESEDGPKLAYYLGQHLDIADEIANASPMAAAMRLGAITAQLSADKPQLKQSAAPEPIEQVASGGVISKDIGDMSMEEVYNS